MVNQSVLNRVLLVEDSSSTALVYRSYLEGDYNVTVAHTGSEALQAIAERAFDLLLLDVRLPDISGLEILQKVREYDAAIPVILMTAHGSVDVAVDAMRFGATDFLTKPFDRARLQVTLKNALKGRRLSEIVDQYEKTCVRDRFHRMVGASLPMQSVYRIIESAAGSRATVFITGESGTGKELCAEAIHAESNRADKPYVALNCAAIPRDLLESEIFGHIKGAFTGAASAREGAAARAAGGTLFLDEIGEMPMDLQSKLLRFVQSGTFQPVGSSKEIKVDVRFICATNRDPLEEVSQGRFREDLYYRLHVIPIPMPPLRERSRDCLLIAGTMLQEFSADEGKQFSAFSPAVESLFLRYRWPGNVRELGNVIRNVVVLNDAELVEPSMLPAPFAEDERGFDLTNLTGIANLAFDKGEPATDASVQKNQEVALDATTTAERAIPEVLPASDTTAVSNPAEHVVANQAAIRPLWLEEKLIIERAIERCGGNVPRAAAFLEISASTIYRKKQQWEKLVV